MRRIKYYDSNFNELIGFDFYCDVAERIIKIRTQKGWTQNDLARESKVKLSRLQQIELVHTRITLPELNKIANVLGVTVDFLIEAKLDCKGQKCLYLVGVKNYGLELYQESTSSRLAVLEFYEELRKICRFDPRDRFCVKLVGVPVTKEELQATFPKRDSKNEYDVLAPDGE